MGDDGGKKFSKNDMERMSLFQEMEYITIGDPYKAQSKGGFNVSAAKDKQMLPGGSKTRSALQAGYFTDKYGRVFEGEAHSDPIKLRRQHRLKESQKNIGKPFLPSSGDKKPSGLGNHYGTLSGPIGAFSPTAKSKKAYQSSGKNFYTNPGRKGTGFGYVGVTFGPNSKYSPDAYDRARQQMRKENESHRSAMKGSAFRLNMAPKALFDENPYKTDKALGPIKKSSDGNKDVKPFKPSSPGKRPGGAHSGTFDPYPSHSVDPYKVRNNRPVHVVNKTGKIFMPSAGPKSAPVASIINYNVVKSINQQNYKTLTSISSF